MLGYGGEGNTHIGLLDMLTQLGPTSGFRSRGLKSNTNPGFSSRKGTY